MFYECLSSGDDIDGNEDLQKDKYKDKNTQTQDKDRNKVLPRPNVCYTYQKQGVQEFKM